LLDDASDAPAHASPNSCRTDLIVVADAAARRRRGSTRSSAAAVLEHPATHDRAADIPPAVAARHLTNR
jgi:hypothetical protein